MKGLFTEAEHEFYVALIGRADNGIVTEGALLLGGLLRQNVIFEGLLTHDLPGAGYLKPLLRTRVGLLFRHIWMCL